MTTLLSFALLGACSVKDSAVDSSRGDAQAARGIYDVVIDVDVNPGAGRGQLSGLELVELSLTGTPSSGAVLLDDLSRSSPLRDLPVTIRIPAQRWRGEGLASVPPILVGALLAVSSSPLTGTYRIEHPQPSQRVTITIGENVQGP